MKDATWFTTEMAAAHLGFLHEDGTPNVRAFATWKWRMAKDGHPVRAYQVGRSTRTLRYRQADLDRVMEVQRAVSSLEEGARQFRVVGARS